MVGIRLDDRLEQVLLRSGRFPGVVRLAGCAAAVADPRFGAFGSQAGPVLVEIWQATQPWAWRAARLCFVAGWQRLGNIRTDDWPGGRGRPRSEAVDSLP
jgi:hypothetical protein